MGIEDETFFASLLNSSEAESILQGLASSFLASASEWLTPTTPVQDGERTKGAGPDYEARYQALAENIPAVIFVAPLEASVGEAYVNQQIETILGFTQEEWLGDPLRWYQQIHPDDRLRWSQEAASLFLTGEPLESTYRVIARNGRVVWFKCDARMVYSQSGKPSFIHGIGFDITELKEAEASLESARQELELRIADRTRELEQINVQLRQEISEHQQTEQKLMAAKEAAESATRIKSEFLANMSHEIRTPMNGVLGLTKLALDTDLNEEQRKYIALAHQSAQSLLTVINQVLDFSKLESGKAHVESVAFDLRTCIDEVVSEFTYVALQKSLSLRSRVAAKCPQWLIGDWGRLKQVLTNLVGNAIKFTQSGGVFLEVVIEAFTGSENTRRCAVQFSVTDTGIGVAADKTKLIFEPFAQADGSVTRNYGGTGLGLSISKDSVELMGGSLQVVSEDGCGSRFSFTLELAVAAGEVSKTAPVDHAKAWADVQKSVSLRLLVAEDNLTNQMIVKAVMEKQGHTVTITNNGQEALEAYLASTFDVVLMDVQMPVMDGLTATAAIRLHEARNKQVHAPIIGLTAHALLADKERCLAAGMDRHLAKPFKADELIGMIAELISEQQPTGCLQ